MGRSFKLFVEAKAVAEAEQLSDDFTQVVAVIDGVCWELDSTISGLHKDAAGYRVHNAANLSGSANYVPGELEVAVGRAKELFEALKPARELAAKWCAEDFATKQEAANVASL